jgi:hypothetical protein
MAASGSSMSCSISFACSFRTGNNCLDFSLDYVAVVEQRQIDRALDFKRHSTFLLIEHNTRRALPELLLRAQKDARIDQDHQNRPTA